MKSLITTLFGSSFATMTLGTVLAGSALSTAPQTASADGFRVNVDINAHRRVERPTYENRQVQVWVEPVYRTVSDKHYVQPVYRTVIDHVWRPAVTQTAYDRVWVPDQFEDRDVRHFGPGGPRIYRERVLVTPGHFEDRGRDVVVRPGCYEDVQRQEVVCEGHWEGADHQELVAPGHWETRIDRVAVDGPRHYEDRSIGIGHIDLHFPGR